MKNRKLTPEEDLALARQHLKSLEPKRKKYEAEVKRIKKEYDQAVAPALARYRKIEEQITKEARKAWALATSEQHRHKISEESQQAREKAWNQFNRETGKQAGERDRQLQEASQIYNQR